MGNIKVLSDEVVSKIAAGEIVERPASVIKELVENSLDAGSAQVQIEIKKGGKKLITVTDNGGGMTRDDALLSIERHATSKIRDIKDVFSIKTLGFRGEALPSIASVSRFRLTTKTKGEIVGTRISIAGGVIKDVEETGCPEGTQVEVKDLFYNTPPRLKFMRTDETELSHILDVVQREAVSYPEVGFEVLCEGKTLFRLPPRESIQERLRELFPDTELFEVKAEAEDIRVYGFMGSPEDKRTTTQKLYTYVNRRAVKDRLLTRVLIESYERLLDKGKFPQGVIFVQVPAEEVDVNVHPTKSEVRFRRSGLVGGLIKTAVQEMLRNAPWIKDYRARVENAVQEFFERRVTFDVPRAHESNVFIPSEKERVALSALNVETRESDDEFKSSPHSSVAQAGISPYKVSPNLFKQEGFFSKLAIIGQIGELYIVCESERGMILIDQHAAHERIRYEKLKGAYLNKELQTQELLFPIVIHLLPSEFQILKECGQDIKSLGIEIEEFGTDSFIVRSVPALIKGANVEKLVKDIIEEIAVLGEEKSLSERIDHIIATMACHSSIRANSGLGREKIKSLLDELDRARFPYSCPHGRPVANELTFQELQKMFKRS